MSLLDNITDLQPGTYTVTRRSTTYGADGRAVVGPPTTLEIYAMITPVTGRQLQTLAAMDAQFTADTHQLFTETPLVVRDDKVTYLGEQWTVQRVQRWDLFGDSVHYEAQITRDAAVPL